MEVFSRVDTMEWIEKKELVTIGDLHTFISNSNEQVTHVFTLLTLIKIEQLMVVTVSAISDELFFGTEAEVGDLRIHTICCIDLK